MDNGSANNPIKYTVESNDITLNNPIKTGYKFTGWTGSNGNIPQKTVTITKGSMGNKSYVAHYEKAEGLDKLDIRDDRIVVFNKLTALSELKELLKIDDIVLKDKKDNVKQDTSKLATKDKITIYGKTYTVIVKGDVDCNGNISFSDVTYIYQFYKGTKQPDEILFLAADIDNNNNISFSDVTRLYTTYKKQKN